MHSEDCKSNETVARRKQSILYCTDKIVEGSNIERYKASKHLSSLGNATSDCANHTCSDISHGHDWLMSGFNVSVDLLIQHDAPNFRLSDDEDDD